MSVVPPKELFLPPQSELIFCVGLSRFYHVYAFFGPAFNRKPNGIYFSAKEISGAPGATWTPDLWFRSSVGCS